MNIFLFAFVLFIFALSFPAYATQWWVSPSGSDSNTCTQAQSSSTPKATITAALACVGPTGGVAGAGHTVIMRNGTYTETVNNKIPGGAVSNPFTLRAENIRKAIWTPSTGEAINQSSASGPSNYVTIDGIYFDGTGGHHNTGPDLIVIGNNFIPTAWTFTNNTFYNAGCDGMIGGGPNWVVRNNVFSNNGLPYDQGKGLQFNLCHGWYASGSNMMIENNDFSNSPNGYGLHMYPGTSDNNNTIRSNRFFGIGSNGAAMVVLGSNHKIYNNLIYNNDNGIQLGGVGNRCSGCEIYSNTIFNSATDYPLYTDGGSFTAKNNIIIGGASILVTGGTAVYGNNFCGTAGTGCAPTLIGDPQFASTNPASVDFLKLSPTSPARDISTATLPAPYNVDIIGTPRPSGAFDLGAYEIAAASTTVTITSPTSSPTTTVTAPGFSLGGTASGDTTNVTWICDRCGKGNAVGTSSWTISGITLLPGANTITVTATGLSVVTDQIVVTYAPSFPGNTLALALSFDACTPPNCADSSGNGNTGSFVNGATTTTAGKFGSALNLDGVNDYMSVPDANSLDFTHSFTYSMWVFPEVVANVYSALLSKDSTITDYVQFLYATSSFNCGSSALVGGFTANGSAGPSFLACKTPPPLPTNQWSHVALTYNGPGPGSSLILYVDGVAVATQGAIGYMEPSTGQLRIGSSPYITEPTFKGRIDEMRAYNWAIPATDSGKLNTTPNLPCGFTTQADRTNMTKVSVVGDMNCPVIQGTPPLLIKIPATASGVKLSGTVKFGSQP